MKVLTIANEKGGVGKTMLSTQFALYCALKFKLRAAVLDLDQQANSTKFFARLNANAAYQGLAVKAPCTAADLYEGKAQALNEVIDSPLLYVPAKSGPQDKRLQDLLEKGGEYNRYAVNLLQVCELLKGHFDIVIIDTNPNPDIRSNSGLIVCTHLLSPFQFAQESIEGLENLFARINEYSLMNDNLPAGFLGMLPNLVESTAVQLKNGQEIISKLGSLLLTVREVRLQAAKDADGQIKLKRDAAGNVLLSPVQSYAAIKRHAGFQMANEQGVPIWDISGQAAAWAELKRAFFTILEQMDLKRPNTASAEMLDVVQTCKQLYGTSWQQLLRQFWLMDNPAILPGLKPEQSNLLRQMRCCVSLSSFIKES